jgi:hypothetical protein
LIAIDKHALHAKLELPPNDREDLPALQQDRAQLIDEVGSFCHEARAHTMQRLNIQLLLALEFDEPQCRS